MPRCIYCNQEKEETLFNKEHVIPQAFGKFGSQTPTLINCVCEECNSYFASVLDPVFSRDTYEGITRYALGIKSREARPQERVQLLLPDTDEYGDFRGARVWLDGEVNGLTMHTQVGFNNAETGKREQLIDAEITKIDALPSHLSNKDIRVLAPSQADHDRMVALLLEKKLIERYEIKEQFTGADLPTVTKPEIRGTVDKMVRRAIAKVAMNFVAKYVGIEEVLNERWNSARGFIRYGTGEIGSRASNKPFWGHETTNVRIGSKTSPDAIYNIRVENQDRGIVVVLEFCHAFLHEILLVENEAIQSNQEIAFAFIPGQEPLLGKKFFV